MKRGKSLCVGILIVLVSVSFVSANWFTDLFKIGEDKEGLEGELPESLDVSVQLGNSAPTIVSWAAPDSDLVTSGIQAYTPTCGGQTSIGTSEFIVTVSDPNGCADLADGVVTVQFSKNGVNRPATAVTCTAVNPATCTGNSLDFDCNGLINMEFYDEQGNWIITVSATDGTDSATPQASDGSANYPFFQYGSNLCIELADSNDPTLPEDTLEWTGVEASTTNLEADNFIIVTNKGNVAIDATTSFLQILANNLVGQTSGDEIEETSFRVDETTLPDPAPCDSDGLLLSETLQNIPNAVLSIGISETEDLYFCLEQINLPAGQSGLTTDTYTTSTPWQIQACGTGC